MDLYKNITFTRSPSSSVHSSLSSASHFPKSFCLLRLTDSRDIFNDSNESSFLLEAENRWSKYCKHDGIICASSKGTLEK